MKWNYPDINATIPPIIMNNIATHNNQIAKAGNIKKIINKIIPRPSNDPPPAFGVSIFSPS